MFGTLTTLEYGILKKAATALLVNSRTARLIPTMDKGVKALEVRFLHSQLQGRSRMHKILMLVTVSVSPTLLAYNQLQLSRFLGGLTSEALAQAVK